MRAAAAASLITVVTLLLWSCDGRPPLPVGHEEAPPEQAAPLPADPTTPPAEIRPSTPIDDGAAPAVATTPPTPVAPPEQRTDRMLLRGADYSEVRLPPAAVKFDTRWFLWDGAGVKFSSLPGQFDHAIRFQFFANGSKAVLVKPVGAEALINGSKHGPSELIVSDVDGANPITIARNAFPIEFSISPDGATLVFTKLDLDYTHLYVAPTDGSASPRPITTREVNDSSPMWFRDGSRIAFARTAVVKDGKLQTTYRSIAPDGTDLTELSAREQREMLFRMNLGQRGDVDSWQALVEDGSNRSVHCAYVFAADMTPMMGFIATANSPYQYHFAPGYEPGSSTSFCCFVYNDRSTISRFLRAEWSEEEQAFKFTRLWHVEGRPDDWMWVDQSAWSYLDVLPESSPSPTPPPVVPDRYLVYLRTSRGLLTIESPPRIAAAMRDVHTTLKDQIAAARAKDAQSMREIRARGEQFFIHAACGHLNETTVQRGDRGILGLLVPNLGPHRAWKPRLALPHPTEVGLDRPSRWSTDAEIFGFRAIIGLANQDPNRFNIIISGGSPNWFDESAKWFGGVSTHQGSIAQGDFIDRVEVFDLSTQ